MNNRRYEDTMNSAMRLLREPRSARDFTYLILAMIPVGYTITYSALGELVGKPPRAIGAYMKYNRYPIVIPCHRVVSKNGLGGFSLGGLEVKKKLLVIEEALDKNNNRLLRVIKTAREFWNVLERQGQTIASIST